MKRLTKHFTTADKIMYSVVGVLIALVFALGIKNAQDVSTIKNSEKTKNEAIYQACLAQKPINTKFIKAFIDTYKAQKKTAFMILHVTPKNSKFYNARRNSVRNYTIVIATLQSFLPVKCTLQK